MIRNLLASIWILIAFSTASAVEHPAGIDVKSSLPSNADIFPGKIFTASFMITNRSSGARILSEDFELPHGWSRISSSESTFELQPGNNSVRLMAVKIPNDCPAGTHFVVYRLKSMTYHDVAFADTIAIEVPEVLNLGLSLTQVPHAIVAGDVWKIILTVSNNGNADLEVNTSIFSDEVNQVTAKPEAFTVKAGSSKQSHIILQSSKKLGRKTESIIKIQSIGRSTTGRQTAAAKTIRIQVLPKVSRQIDPYVRVPTTLKLTGTGDRSHGAYQVEISGGGNLTEDGSNVEFVLKLPDIEDVARYTSRDMISLSYSQGPFRIHIGDRGYSLSPLLERYNYARGLELTYENTRFDVSAFYTQRRWLVKPHKEAGVGIRLRIGQKASLKTNFLSKKDESVNDGSRQSLFGLEGAFALPGDGEAGFELALNPDEKPSASTAGGRLSLRGRLPHDGNFAFEWIRAGPDFRGYYNDSEYIVGSLRIPVVARLTSRTNLRSYARNLNNDPSQLSAIRERQFTTDILFRLAGSSRFALDLHRFSRRDDLPGSKLNFSEQTVKLTAARTGHALSLSGSVERGKLFNKSTDSESSLERYSCSLVWRPTSDQSYSFYGHTGLSYYTVEPRRYRNIGISGTWSLIPNLTLRIRLLRNQYLSEVDRCYSEVSGTIRWVLSPAQSLTLSANVEQNTHDHTDIALLLQYTTTFGIPLSRKKSLGSLVGMVYRGGMPHHEPVPSVIIIVDGNVAVTDAEGRFELPALRPGFHSLYLDPKSLGIGMTTQRPMPMVVTIEGGKVTKLNIGVVLECNITGTFQVQAPDLVPVRLDNSPDELNVVVAEPHINFDEIVVQVSNQDETFVEQPGTDGRFAFNHLRPGKWQVRPITRQSAPDYVFEPDEITIEVDAGQSTEVIFRILPKKRLLRIIDRGEIRLRSD